ncbi:serine hydrolase [Bowmanella sp. JS7-9]|uniref:Serine hydrolase domain-containing protein n=1 Tax=Pseudobowmanella zhangzhouensis TaxID=1537679 RepID=A0ABW1XNN3_9ALTE|nr:serine hydrolase domain-containing protein [Bowmanella sp. JS7-9]TBX22465.1 beta-lactamase [Bowmanella sp. JS7-9]
MNKKTRTTILRVILFGGTAISLFFVPWIIVKAWLMPLPGSVQQQVNDAITYGFDGMLVYVQQGDQLGQSYTAGWHDRDNKLPARGDALFKIGSINKLYVASAITLLISDGKLHNEGTLAEYFPELESRIQYADQITLANLVGHTSGIPNFTDTYAYWENPPDTQAEQLALILDKPANFKPGDGYEYSNTNYLLLGELIARAAGVSQAQFIQQRILAPLNLTHTYFSLDEVNMDDLMGGYYVGVEPDIKTNDYGAMIASADDLATFVRALNTGELFTPEQQAIYSSLYVYEHGGLIPGYQTYTAYYPDIDTVVVQCINTTDFNGYEWNLSQVFFSRIGKILHQN